nr:uncharacterized protein LOC111418431 [Onthophagus taurus]
MVEIENVNSILVTETIYNFYFLNGMRSKTFSNKTIKGNLEIIVSISLGSMYVERAIVTDATLKNQGYSCYKPGLNPMKDKEVNAKPTPYSCEKVGCQNGVLIFERCPMVNIENDKAPPGDITKPYPFCCYDL